MLALAIGCAFAAALGSGVAGHLPRLPGDAAKLAASSRTVPPEARTRPAPPPRPLALAAAKSPRLAQAVHEAPAATAVLPANEGRPIALAGDTGAMPLGLPQRLFAPAATAATSFQPSAAFRVALTDSRKIAYALPASMPAPAAATLVATIPIPAPDAVPTAPEAPAPVQLAMLEPTSPAAETPETGLDAAIPVPRARPRHRMKAPAESLARAPAASRREIAAPVLAYARPDAGDDALAASRPSLVRPGKGVAVYDISAATVYLPNGEKLEAHSGLGAMRDDPSFAHKKMRGPTPPHTYTLALRESLFHGVRAIRLHPVGGQKAIHNRNGLLAHTYMLGKGGDSNGCVSFKDYKRFLAAFDRGEIQKLVVVERLATNPVARFASIFR